MPLDNLNPSVQALRDGQTATDVFSYTNEDNHGASSTTTLTVTVTGTNDAPTAEGDSYNWSMDTSITIPVRKGVELAPSSDDPSKMSLWVADYGYDQHATPDGRRFEIPLHVPFENSLLV
ncbi:VCBS domain-containing protein (plasmid) [Sinorhizobium chiapasense]